MADEEPPGASGVGLEVEQSARSYGGAVWALQNFFYQELEVYFKINLRKPPTWD